MAVTLQPRILRGEPMYPVIIMRWSQLLQMVTQLQQLEEILLLGDEPQTENQSKLLSSTGKKICSMLSICLRATSVNGDATPCLLHNRNREGGEEDLTSLPLKPSSASSLKLGAGLKLGSATFLLVVVSFHLSSSRP